ncbi:MAG: hypothetical protein KAS32_08860, partial [Candidatus Peribacteraceae bacterium]|nr:hypothetical protein [Candidatus Peribacteraceae bacterium]
KCVIDKWKPINRFYKTSFLTTYEWANIYDRFKVETKGETRNKKIKESLALTWIGGKGGTDTRQMIEGDGFNPNQGVIFIDEERREVINNYTGFYYDELEEPPDTPEYREFAKILDNAILWHCEGRIDEFKVIKGFLAHLIQRPGIRPPFALLLISALFGTGKTSLLTLFSYVMGTRYVSELDMHDVPSFSTGSRSQFDDGIVDILLNIFNEIDLSRKEGIEAYMKMKSLITDSSRRVNLKGGAKLKKKLFQGIIACSNNENPIHLPKGDRRWFVSAFEGTKKMYLDDEYKTQIVKERFKEAHFVDNSIDSMNPKLRERAHKICHAIFYDLKNYDLKEFIALNGPPMTKHKEFMLHKSLDDIDQQLQSLVAVADKFIIRNQLHEYLEKRVDGYDQLKSSQKYAAIDKVYPVNSDIKVYVDDKTYDIGGPGKKRQFRIRATKTGGYDIKHWSTQAPRGYKGRKGMLKYIVEKCANVQKIIGNESKELEHNPFHS